MEEIIITRVVQDLSWSKTGASNTGTQCAIYRGDDDLFKGQHTNRGFPSGFHGGVTGDCRGICSIQLNTMIYMGRQWFTFDLRHSSYQQNHTGRKSKFCRSQMRPTIEAVANLCKSLGWPGSQGYRRCFAAFETPAASVRSESRRSELAVSNAPSMTHDLRVCAVVRRLGPGSDKRTTSED